MNSTLGRVVATLRVWLGLNDPSENHLHQAHGWLLPATAPERARATQSKATEGRLPVSRRS